VSTRKIEHGYVIQGDTIIKGLMGLSFALILLSLCLVYLINSHREEVSDYKFNEGVVSEKIAWLESQMLEINEIKEELYKRRILDGNFKEEQEQ
jgi:hypothetical protein